MPERSMRRTRAGRFRDSRPWTRVPMRSRPEAQRRRRPHAISISMRPSSIFLLGTYCVIYARAFVSVPRWNRPGRYSLDTSLSTTTRLEAGDVLMDPPCTPGSAVEEAGETYYDGIRFSKEEAALFVTSKGKKICLLTGLSPCWSTASGNRAANRNGIFFHSHHPTEKSAFDTSLGKLSTCHRFLACARLTRYWMGPSFGGGSNSCKDIPIDTQFLLVEMEKGGPYALFLPLLDGNFRASLSGERNGELMCRQESGDDAVLASGMKAVYCAVGDDPFELVGEGFQRVAEETKTFATLNMKKLPPNVDEFGWCTWDAFYSEVTPQGVIDGVRSLREAGIQPKTVILDDGWQQVEPKKKPVSQTITSAKSNADAPFATNLASTILMVLSKVVTAFYERFVRTAKHNSLANRLWRFLTRTVLKGQMWEYFEDETDFARQLSGFEPNEKFQQSTDGSSMGLKELVAKLKTELGVTHLFCWHALHGYWRGVAPELGEKKGFYVTNAMPKLSEHLLQVEPILAWDSVSLFGVGLVTDEQEATKFYDLLHTPLKDANVDGVKVDVQSGVASLGGGTGGASRIARIYTNALEKSLLTRFTPSDGAPSCINCMCHSTENLYRYKKTSVARASDDFYPRRPNSHTVHLVNVAYNSLFIGEICLPDWDMFHSKHESGALHAAARAVSGGPVYVSDAPGEHDALLLKRLVLEDGTVLRCLRHGRPTRDCLFTDVGRDATTVLKIWNENNYGGVVGLFNSQGVAWNFKTHENEIVNTAQTLKVLARPHDVESLRNIPGPFVAYSQRSACLTYLPDRKAGVEMMIDPREWDIITIVPVQEHAMNSNNSIAWAPIGLCDMLNSGGALADVSNFDTLKESSSSSPQEKHVTFTCRGPGRFVAYPRPEPSHVFLTNRQKNPMSLPFTYDRQNRGLSFVLPSETEGKCHGVKVAWG